MNFIGLKKEEDRAAVIEYLRLASDNPIPRPDPAPGPQDLIDAAPMDESSVVVEAPDSEGLVETKPEMATEEQ